MIKHGLMKINLSYMIWYIKLQYEIEFLTRFLENLLSCSYFTKNVIRRSREVDSIAPPTLIAFEDYVMNLQTPPKKRSQ